VTLLVEVSHGESRMTRQTLAVKKRSLRYGQPSLHDNDTAGSARLSSNEHRSVQYIETADASVYPKVCYYPVTEGSRPVECVPLVEESPKTDFDLRASSKMSTAVRLNPTDLTVPVILEQSSLLCSTPNKLGAFASSLRRLADGALRFGATQLISAVFAASEEVPECASGHRITRR